MELVLGDRERAFADALPDGILIVDEHGRIVFASRQLAALTGYDPDGLVGLPVETLVPERHREAYRQHRTAFAAAPRTRPMGSGLEIVLRRRDGSELPVDIALRPRQPDDAGQVVAAVRDASERKQLEQALWAAGRTEWTLAPRHGRRDWSRKAMTRSSAARVG